MDTVLKNYFEKSKEIGEKRNIVIKTVFKKKNCIYVRGYNYNRNRFGEEYGDFEQLYYSFLKGLRSKKEMSDELALSTEEWVNKAKEVHPEYDYSITEYINNRVPVKILCPKHGVFSVMTKVFVKPEYKCAKCLKYESFISNKEVLYLELKKKFPNYEFDLSTYKTLNSKIRIICPKHGEYWQSVKYALRSFGCPKCVNEINGRKQRTPLNKFIEQAREVHGDKYDYSKVEYVNNSTKICIICPEHGEFWQEPATHLRSQGCPKCSHTYKRTKDDFIEDARKVHGDKYDYSKVEYVDTKTKVCIICHEKDEFGNEHGEFWQTPKNHLKGYGCKKCSNNFLDENIFILKSQKIHGDKYDYSKVEYVNNKTKVCIICPEHGEFWQIPNCHLSGQGCPLCKTSHLEREMKQFLVDNEINHVYQYHNKDIFDRQSFDFYLPEYNIAVECQGEQHYVANFFKSKGIEYAEKHLEYIQGLDKKKRDIAKENGITVLYYLNKKFLKYINEENRNNCYTSKKELLKRIKEVKN